MNIVQTRQLLSFLWSKFPNSRALSVEDKQMTTLAYFDELWQYSLQDALDAARCALREQPHFVPSATEIAHYAHKTFDPTAYLSPEYAKTQAQIDQLEQKLIDERPAYEAAFEARADLNSGVIVNLMSPEKRARFQAEYDRLTTIIEAYLDLNDERLRIVQKKAALWQAAISDASLAYNSTESALANQDFQQLGWIERRTAIVGAETLEDFKRVTRRTEK